MLKYLKLIRIQNLLIIALAQYLIRYALLIPSLEALGYQAQFSHLNFAFLVLATTSLAAAGYVINDYFDTKTDILNRPSSVIVGKTVKRRTAMTLHVILNIIGIIAGFYISIQIGMWKLIYIYILISGLLWFYSANFKRRFLIGNLIVAFMTGLAILLPVLYEIPPLITEYAETLRLLHTNFNRLFNWGLAFALFAFLTTLAREIIKDAEDFEGDQAYGRQTLPIVLGIKNTKIIITALNSFIALLLIFGYFHYLYCMKSLGTACLKIDYISMIYIGLFLVLPQFFLTYKIYKAQTQQEWHHAATLSKIIMLFGILYAGVVYIIINT